jgi:hypothetical protein
MLSLQATLHQTTFALLPHQQQVLHSSPTTDLRNDTVSQLPQLRSFPLVMRFGALASAGFFSFPLALHPTSAI